MERWIPRLIWSLEWIVRIAAAGKNPKAAWRGVPFEDIITLFRSRPLVRVTFPHIPASSGNWLRLVDVVPLHLD